MFKCFSSRLANFLVKRGFEIKDTEPNLKKPQFDVFIFENSDELKTALEEYMLLKQLKTHLEKIETK